MSYHAEHRHHRRGGDAQGAAGQREAPAGQARGGGRPRAGRGGGMVPQPADAWATPSCSRARCCASKASTSSARWPRAATTREPMMPSYQGGKFPLSTYLAERVREMLADPKPGTHLPPQVQDWLSLQRFKSVVPQAERDAGRDLPARRQALHGLLPLRGPSGAPDAGHAADAAAGARGAAAPGLRRLGICAGDLDGARPLADDLERPDLARHGSSTRT